MKSKESIIEAVVAGLAAIIGGILLLIVFAFAFPPPETETGLKSSESPAQQGVYDDR